VLLLGDGHERLELHQRHASIAITIPRPR
jgi:hypothetical protein